jgi:hypothetical protein
MSKPIKRSLSDCEESDAKKLRNGSQEMDTCTSESSNQSVKFERTVPATTSCQSLRSIMLTQTKQIDLTDIPTIGLTRTQSLYATSPQQNNSVAFDRLRALFTGQSNSSVNEDYDEIETSHDFKSQVPFIDMTSNDSVKSAFILEHIHNTFLKKD